MNPFFGEEEIKFGEVLIKVLRNREWKKNNLFNKTKQKKRKKKNPEKTNCANCKYFPLFIAEKKKKTVPFVINTIYVSKFNVLKT